jgi:hypothetical protein
MQNSIDQTIQTIDQLHSQWLMMDKAAKLVWLRQQQNQLNALAGQLSYSINLRKGRMTDAEKQYAYELLEMLDAVNAEGAKVSNEFRTDLLKESIKG